MRSVAAVNAPSFGSSRIGWLDLARGIGIVLVVIGHALRGLITANVVPDANVWQMIDRGIYAFHMPLFFFLAGLVFPSRPLPAGAFLTRQATRLIWPLFLWTWIFFALHLAAPATNMPSTVQDFPWLPLPPRLHFWFLWALFLASCLGWLVKQQIAAARLVAVIALAAMIWSAQTTAGGMVWFGPALANVLFFVAGLLLTLAPFRALSDLSRTPSTATAVVAAAIFTVAVGVAIIAQPGGFLAMQLIALCAVGGLVVTLAILPLRGALPGAVQFCGRNSMGIFLTHTIFTAGIRVVLVTIGINDPAMHIILGVAAGLLAPLLLVNLVHRAGLTRLVGF